TSLQLSNLDFYLVLITVYALLLQVACCFSSMSLYWALPRSSGLFPIACGYLPKPLRLILKQYMIEKSLLARSHKFHHDSTLQTTPMNVDSAIAVRPAAHLR